MGLVLVILAANVTKSFAVHKRLVKKYYYSYFIFSSDALMKKNLRRGTCPPTTQK
jgi:hypothetical protein